VVDLLERLDIELSPEALLLAVNGRVAEPERELVDGDQVNLMPAISGGSGRTLDWDGERFQLQPGDSESNPAGSRTSRGKEMIVCAHWY
jgi:hypothetical protein